MNMNILVLLKLFIIKYIFKQHVIFLKFLNFGAILNLILFQLTANLA